MPKCPARAGHPRQLAAHAARVAMWLADPQFIAVEAPRSASRGSRASAEGCPSTAGRSAPLSSARKPRFRPTPSSGKPMADRESEVIAKIASGVSGLNGRAWDRLGGGEPFVSHAFLSALEDSGSVGPRHRLDSRAHPRRGRGRASRGGGARLSEDPQPGRICVRPRLGRGVAARRRRILPKAAGRGAVHARAGTAAARQPSSAAAGRHRGGDGAERDVVGAHHLCR